MATNYPYPYLPNGSPNYAGGNGAGFWEAPAAPAAPPQNASNGYYPTPTDAPVYSNTGVMPYNAPRPNSGLGYGDKTQGQASNVNQIPVNVLDVLSGRAGRGQTSQGLGFGISDVLNNYYNKANSYLNQFSPQSSSNPSGFNLPQVNLSSNFAGVNDLNSSLNGGIDYFGRLGISEGLNNINAQRNASNAAIANSLGKTAGNQSLISVLQNQNNLQSRLAGQPLVSEAQQGTYQRALGNVGLQNDVTGLQNQTQLADRGFNLQSILSGLNAQTQGVQPLQNLLDTLTTLQGQQRGVTSSESQIGSRNFA